MIWFTWRQHRVQTLISAAALAAVSVLLLATARIMSDLYAEVAACSSSCDDVLHMFLVNFHNSAAFPVYFTGLGAVYLTPLLFGVFWGAPMIARELETGTHRLVWNQSVTRTRWLAVKLATGCTVAATTTGLLSWAVTAWSRHVDIASHDLMVPLLFGGRGIVPVAYAVFAFLLGATTGMLVRRVVPAIAATLVIYVGAIVAMPLWLRAHLVAPQHDMIALDPTNLLGININEDARTIEVIGGDLEGAWTISNRTITSTGAIFTGPVDLTICGPQGAPATCNQWLASQGLRQDVLYHPLSHFWPLQWAEAGVFIGLAALLAAFSFWWIRHRVV